MRAASDAPLLGGGAEADNAATNRVGWAATPASPPPPPEPPPARRSEGWKKAPRMVASGGSEARYGAERLARGSSG
eukprot:4273663-Pleurochrysis_carterae.AAC.1